MQGRQAGVKDVPPEVTPRQGDATRLSHNSKSRMAEARGCSRRSISHARAMLPTQLAPVLWVRVPKAHKGRRRRQM